MSISGQQESQINLAIALELDQLMGFYGVPTVMTRSSDVSIHDAQASTCGRKSVRPPQTGWIGSTRWKMPPSSASIRTRPPTPVSGDSGVLRGRRNPFPPPGPEGAGNHDLGAVPRKEAFCSARGRFGLSHESHCLPRHPSGVRVLSNPEEDRLLQEPAYQRKLAMVLASSYLTSGSAQEGESFV